MERGNFKDVQDLSREVLCQNEACGMAAMD